MGARMCSQFCRHLKSMGKKLSLLRNRLAFDILVDGFSESAFFAVTTKLTQYWFPKSIFLDLLVFRDDFNVTISNFIEISLIPQLVVKKTCHHLFLNVDFINNLLLFFLH